MITDTPSVMKSTWSDLGAQDPKLLCMGCWGHILTLLIKGICSSEVIAGRVAEATDIVKLFKRQQINNGLLGEEQKRLKIKQGLTLPAATRFAGVALLLEHLMVNKPALQVSEIILRKCDCHECCRKCDAPINVFMQATVVGPNFNNELGDFPGKKKKKRAIPTEQKARAERVKEILLREDWWEDIAFLTRLLEPVATAIIQIQSDKCTQGKVNHYNYDPRFHTLLSFIII